jgi:hypothetical protein
METMTTQSNTRVAWSTITRQMYEEPKKEVVGEDGKVIIVAKRRTPGGRKSAKGRKSPNAPPMSSKTIREAMEKEIEKKIVENAWDWNS